MDDTSALLPWLRACAERLGVAESDLPDIDTVLGVAGVAAHGVARPAAPLTTFLLGVAAARSGRPLAELAAEVKALVAQTEPIEA